MQEPLTSEAGGPKTTKAASSRREGSFGPEQRHAGEGEGGSSTLQVTRQMSSFLLLKPSPRGEGSSMKVNKDKGLDHVVTAQPTGGVVHRWDQQEIDAWLTSGREGPRAA